LAKPDAHAWMAHVPAEQVDVALGAEHTCPQPPQLFTSVLRFRHTPLHSVWPGAHEATHAPAWHTVPAGHWASLVQPLQTPAPSHTPVGQDVPAGALAKPHVPPTHVAVVHAFVDGGQSAGDVQVPDEAPQVPSLLHTVPLGHVSTTPSQSLSRPLVQLNGWGAPGVQLHGPHVPSLPQVCVPDRWHTPTPHVPQPCTAPGEHTPEQVPLTQAVPDGQTVPQAPQLLGLFDVLTQAPLHHVWPVGQVGLHVQATCTHTPLRHTESLAHECPQVPQLSLFEVRSRHSPPQEVSPGGHDEPPPPGLAALAAWAPSTVAPAPTPRAARARPSSFLRPMPSGAATALAKSSNRSLRSVMLHPPLARR